MLKAIIFSLLVNYYFCTAIFESRTKNENVSIRKNAAVRSSNLTERTKIEFPNFLSSTIIITLNPLDRIFDTAEVQLLEDGLEYFYQQIFTSQTEFDIILGSVNIVGQSVREGDTTLNLESLVDVNFKPADENQELTKTDYHNLLINLINHFSSELTNYLDKVKYESFPNIKLIQALDPPDYPSDKVTKKEYTKELGASKRGGNWSYTIGFIVTATALAVFSYAFFIYRKKVGSQMYNKTYNISPFKENLQEEEVDFYDDDDIDANPRSSGSRFSFIPPIEDDNSTIETSLMASLREDFSPELDQELSAKHQQISLDKIVTSVEQSEVDKQNNTNINNEKFESNKVEIINREEMEGNNMGDFKNKKNYAELWAPAGKLGVAIDIVDSTPVVWRIKEGSPLKGFLKPGDRLMAIDEIDTSSMSAADVTSIMVRRMRQRRKITYVRL